MRESWLGQEGSGEGAKEGAWDIGFIAIEPVRAADIDFTAPYVIIEGTYMVQKDSPLKEIADVDKAGIRIAVGRGSAYDLYLTRPIKNATIVRAAVGGGRAMIEMWVNDRLEAAAGVRQQLEAYAKDHPEVRIMSGAFQQIQQAMGMPKGRDVGVRALRTVQVLGVVLIVGYVLLLQRAAVLPEYNRFGALVVVPILLAVNVALLTVGGALWGTKVWLTGVVVLSFVFPLMIWRRWRDRVAAGAPAVAAPANGG